MGAFLYCVLWPVCAIGFSEHGRMIQTTWGGASVSSLLCNLWRHDDGQDIAEYAVMLAVILVIVVGTVRLVGSHANNVFSTVASAIP